MFFRLNFTFPLRCIDTANIFIFHLLSNEIESYGNFPFYMDTVPIWKSVEDDELKNILWKRKQRWN